MSTSIKIFAEQLQHGQWLPTPKANDKLQKNLFPVQAISLGQDYELFAVLAGVRQERFRDCYRATIKPIAPPRGLPKDLSPLLRSYFTKPHSDYSSLSWFLVQELVNFEWTKHTVTMYARVHKRFAHLFSGYGSFPYEDWTKEAELYQLNLPYRSDTVEVSWIETYKEFVCRECFDLYDYFMGELLSLGSPQMVRIIFGFN